MSDKVFRLLERLQKLDDLLRRASSRHVRDPLEIALLTALKRKVKRRLTRSDFRLATLH